MHIGALTAQVKGLINERSEIYRVFNGNTASEFRDNLLDTFSAFGLTEERGLESWKRFFGEIVDISRVKSFLIPILLVRLL